MRSTCEQVREQLSSAEQGRQEAWQRRCEAEGLLEERAAVFSALQEEVRALRCVFVFSLAPSLPPAVLES